VRKSKLFFAVLFAAASARAWGADSDPIGQALVPMQSILSARVSIDLGDVSFIGSVPDPAARNRLMQKIFLVAGAGTGGGAMASFNAVDEDGFQRRLAEPSPFCALMFLNADRMLSDQQFEQMGLARPAALAAGTPFKMDYAPDAETAFVNASRPFNSGLSGMKPFTAVSNSLVATLKFRLFDGVAAPRMLCVIPSAENRAPSLGEVKALLAGALAVRL